MNDAPAIFSLPLLQNPLFLVALFVGGSLLMVWRLELMNQRGLEGTVLGTLVMPYCSGIGNLVFVFIALRQNLPKTEVVTNSLVNNVTNMTLLIGLPAIIWGVTTSRSKPNQKRKVVAQQRLNRLSILLTLTAVLFFSGATWVLGRDGNFDRNDGFVLVGLFLFWQCFHLFDVLKTNVVQRRSLPWLLALDFVLLLFGGFDVYLSIEGLVLWLKNTGSDSGFLNPNQAGWLSGWLMVLPNALLAIYYGWRRKPEVIYTSQIGDGHICIPLCIGLAALIAPDTAPILTPGMFNNAVLILVGSVGIHFIVVGVFGQLPRIFGIVLSLIYIYFVYAGLIA